MYNFYNIGLNYTNEVQYEVQLKSIIKAGQQTVEGSFSPPHLTGVEVTAADHQKPGLNRLTSASSVCLWKESWLQRCLASCGLMSGKGTADRGLILRLFLGAFAS